MNRSTRRLLRICAFVLTAWAAVSLAREPAGIVAAGTSNATPYYIQATGIAGPTVMIVGGMHGDEPAGAAAAEQIRQWPILRGKIVVVPRANVLALDAAKRTTPGEADSLSNLNRNFPKPGEKGPARGALAVAIWELVRQQKPDWLLDLHEGGDFRAGGSKSVGGSVIAHQTPAAKTAAALMVEAGNAGITNANQHFVLLRSPIAGSLARAAGEHLGAQAMIVETAIKGQPRSLRTRQHRTMVLALLKHLGMVGETVTADRMTDRSTAGRESLSIAVYDGGGTGGAGGARIRKIMEGRGRAAVMEVGPADIRNGALEQFDVLVCPGGSGSAQAAAIGEAGSKRIREFVRDGGGYIGICAGAYLATSGFTWGLKILDARTASSKWNRGHGVVRLELTDRGREILGARDGTFDCKYASGPILVPANVEELPDFEPLAFFRTEVAGNGTPAGIMVNTAALAAGSFGKGRVLVMSPHPEQTPGLEGIVVQALAWVANVTPAKSQ